MEKRVVVSLSPDTEIEVHLPEDRVLYLTIEGERGYPVMTIRDTEGRPIYGAALEIFAERGA